MQINLKLGFGKNVSKNSVEDFFFLTSKWWIESRWRQQTLSFSFGSHTVISQPIVKCKPIFNVS
jgi:hypothetical protein